MRYNKIAKNEKLIKIIKMKNCQNNSHSPAVAVQLNQEFPIKQESMRSAVQLMCIYGTGRKYYLIKVSFRGNVTAQRLA